MSLAGYYYNGQHVKLNSWYSRRAYYNCHLGMALAKQRLNKLFAASEVDRIIDEVC